MDDSLKEQMILKDYLSSKGVSLDDDKFNQFYSKYQSRKTGTAGDILNRATAGMKSAIASGQMIFGDYDGASENIKEANALRTEDPELQERMNKIAESESVSETLGSLVKDPKAAFSYLAESLPLSIGAGLTAIPTGKVANTLVKGGLPVARAVGAGTFGGIIGASEYGATILQTLAEAGVDIENPDEIEAVLIDPEIGPRLKERGLQRGVPIAMFDAVSFGIAGRLASMGRGVAGKTAAYSAEAAAQAGIGGGGEYTAQMVSDGEVTDPAAIGLEIGLGALTGVPQAIVQPALESLLQGTPEGSESQIRGPKTNPQQLMDGIVELDTEAAPITTPEAGVTPPNNTKLESAVRTAENRTAPNEIARGTPKQMKSRLMALSKAELTERAIKNAGLDEASVTGVGKSEIADKILSRYEINQTKPDVVQTPKETAIKDATPVRKEIPENLKGINEPSRQELLKVAQAEIKNDANRPLPELLRLKDKQEAANNWLSQLPDNVALAKGLTGLSRNKNKLKFTGVNLEKANQAIKKIKSPNTNDSTKTKATGDLISNLKETGYFAPDEISTLEGKNPELVTYVQDMYNTGKEDGTKELIENLLSSPKTRDAIVGDIFDGYRKGTQAKVDTPTLNRLGRKFSKFINKDIEVPKHRLARDPELAPKEQLEQNAKDIQEISEYNILKTIEDMKEHYNTPDALDNVIENFVPDRELIRKNASAGTFKMMWHHIDMVKTIPQLVRENPFMADFFNTYLAKNSVREQLNKNDLNDFALLIKNAGEKKSVAGFAIIDAMTGPHNKSGPQPLIKNEAGQLRFKDKDGQRKVVDPATTQFIYDVHNMYKNKIVLENQMYRKEMAEKFPSIPENSEREALMDKIEEFYALGDDVNAKSLETFVEIFDEQEKLFRSNKTYLPHTRNEGPFAVSTYRKVKDKDSGKETYELAGLYSIRADKFGNIDDSHLSEVRQRIEQDQEQDGEAHYSIDGLSPTGSEAFKLNRNFIENNIMRNIKDPAFAYELLGNLLTNKSIDPQVINDVFDTYQLDNESKKFIKNYREKKNYFGYDNGDFIESTIESLLNRNGLITRFMYDRKLSKAATVAKNELTKGNNAGAKVAKTLNKYMDYINSPVDDAAYIRKIGFWYFLAFNPSTSLLQLVSTYINAVPWTLQYQGLGGYAKTQVQSFTNLPKAVNIRKHMNLLTKPTMEEFMAKTKTDKESAEIFRYLVDRGALSPSFALDYLSTTKNQRKKNRFLSRNNRNLASKSFDTAKSVGESMIQLPEDVARINSAMLFIDSMKSTKNFEKIGKLLWNKDALFRSTVKTRHEGRITKKAIVEHALGETHIIFGKEARPEMTRSQIGAALFAFQQYPMGIIETHLRLLNSRGAAGKAAAAGMVVQLVAFGGLTALPMYTTWDWLTQWAQRLTGEEGATNKELALIKLLDLAGLSESPKIKNFIMKGALSSGAGIDISSRIAPQAFFQPFLDVGANPDDSGMAPMSQALQFAGPFSQFLTGGQNALAQMEGGTGVVDALTTNLAPVWMRNLKKAKDLSEGDLRNTRGKRLLPSYEEDPRPFDNKTVVERLTGIKTKDRDEVVRQAMGLRPNAVSEASRLHYFQSLEKNAQTGGASKAYGRIADAMIAERKGEKGAREERLAAIKDAWALNNKSKNPKTWKEFTRTVKSSVRDRIVSEENPLQQRKPISKKTKITEDAYRYGLPTVMDAVKNKE